MHGVLEHLKSNCGEEASGKGLSRKYALILLIVDFTALLLFEGVNTEFKHIKQALAVKLRIVKCTLKLEKFRYKCVLKSILAKRLVVALVRPLT
jgi:hypothetical protein